MAKRYEWSPQHWEQLKDSHPGKGTDRGRPAGDNRRFVNGGLWGVRSGARWGALPARSGHWKRIQKRLTRGARAGV